MKVEKWLSDPIFQLNLLLWMALDQPAGARRVRPLFRELNFSIAYIEQPFSFPIETSNAINAAGFSIVTEPEPDLILVRLADHRAIYFECKAHSFGAASTNSAQARAHLIAAGPAFAEVYEPLKDCLLCYLVPDADRAGMDECLRNLSQQLAAANFEAGRHSTHGLLATGDAVKYRWDDTFARHAGAAGLEAEIMDVEEAQIQYR